MGLPAGESSLDPRFISFSFRKHLSPKALNEKLRLRFSEIADSRNKNKVVIPLCDALMCGFGLFVLKVPSLLAFDSLRFFDARRANIKNLLGVENIPSDTTMREILDEVNPDDLRPAFSDVFFQLQRAKVLEPYAFINGRYLLAIDGTEYFSSDKVHCDSCLEKHHKKSGTTSYHHQMLGAVLIHPDQQNVIPLCPEPIIRQDGQKKNDCERNACRRILEKIRQDHPRLGLVITEDGLASNAPHIRDLKRLDMSFILGAKPGDHKFLFEEYATSGSRCKQATQVAGEIVHVFNYVNDLQLNEKNEDVRVNFLNYEERHPSGKVQRFSWVTDIEINEGNVYAIMRGGRARWKVENETFNTLKNQGYEFEHNFGHGLKNLSVVFAFLMMLAFLVDQAQLASNKLVQAALAKEKRLKELYRVVRGLFDTFIFTDWSEIYSAIAYGYEASIKLNFPPRNTS